MLLVATDPKCVEQAVAICSQLGPLGPFVFMALAAGVAALFERWNRYRVERRAEEKLAEQKAEAAAAQLAAAEALAKVKAERNAHAAKAQELEVKVAVAESLRPPPPPGGES